MACVKNRNLWGDSQRRLGTLGSLLGDHLGTMKVRFNSCSTNLALQMVLIGSVMGGPILYDFSKTSLVSRSGTLLKAREVVEEWHTCFACAYGSCVAFVPNCLDILRAE